MSLARTSASAGRAVLLCAAFVLSATVAAALVVRSPFGSPAAPLLIGVACLVPVWMVLTRRVELSLAVLLVYLGLADGYLKLRFDVEAVAIGRDLLLFAIAAGMLVRFAVRGGSLTLPPLTAWVLLWLGIVAAQLLNPLNGSYLHSIASTRQHIAFVPLFFMAFVVLRSTARLRGFTVLVLVVAAVNGVVGLYQAGLTPEQMSSWGPGYSKLINGTGGGAPRLAVGPDGKPRVRPPGLGSDMGFAGILGAIAVPGGLALLLGAGRRRWALLYGLLVIAAALGPITSQSRSALVTTVVALIAFAGLALAAGQGRRVVAGLLVVAVLALVVISVVTNTQGDDTFYRYKTVAPGQVVTTTIESRSGTFENIPIYAQLYPFGGGIGTTGPAAGVIDPPAPRLYNAESQFTFLLIEVGVLGTLAFLAFYGHLLWTAVSKLRRLSDEPAAQLLLAGIAAPLFAFVGNWIVGVNTVSTPNAPWLWFAAGVLSWWLLARPTVSSRNA
jgi:hypothetical protein